MAPNPNECAVLLQGSVESEPRAPVRAPVLVKIVMTSSDDSSEDGEHFYDASSEVHFSDENETAGSCKDSGVEADKEPEFVAPDDDLAAQIIEQVEFYFSDSHILKDAFLLKHARRNRDGYISLKLITSFKKVKHVTKDWRVVAFACRQSKCLEVNEAGTKVRRTAPLPESDETSPSRTIVAIGIPLEKACIESVAEMFSSAGSIALIRILRPGSAIPPDVRQCANRNPDILTSICAVIEFETADSARAALRDAAAALTRPNVHVIELATRRSAGSKPASRPLTPSPVEVCSEANSPASRRTKRRGPNAAYKNKFINAVNAQDTANGSSSETEEKSSPFLCRKDFSAVSSLASTPNHSPQLGRYNVALRNQHARQSMTSSPVLDMQFGRQKSASCSEPGSPGSHSPWVRRRLAAVSAPQSGRCSPQVVTMTDNRLSVPTNIVRMPLGPDGTRGFQLLKPRSASAPEVPRMVAVAAAL